MGERSYAYRTGARSRPAPRVFGALHGAADAPAPLPAPGAGPAGHDLARIAVSAPPAGEAPIQRMRWTWDAANRSWSGPPGASHARQPPHPGRVDGEEYEDNR